MIQFFVLITLLNLICFCSNGLQQIERSLEYSNATASFRKVLDNLENQFQFGTRNNYMLNDNDLSEAYNEYKNWDPKLRLKVTITEPRSYLLVMLLVYYGQKQNVEEFFRLYFIVRPIYQKRIPKEKAGIQNLKLAALFLLNKPIDVDQLEDAKYEYDEMINQLSSLTAEDEELIETILDLISREDIQIIRDNLYPLVNSNGLKATKSMESMRKLFTDKYRERGWIVEDGKKKYLYMDFYQQLMNKG